MKYSIRKGCWESNSSSVHTITISKAGLEKNRMNISAMFEDIKTKSVVF